MKVIDHENIQDGHHTDWDEQEMLRILTAETRANAINTVRHPCHWQLRLLVAP